MTNKDLLSKTYNQLDNKNKQPNFLKKIEYQNKHFSKDIYRWTLGT